MASFALLNNENIVENIVYVDDSVLFDEDGVEHEHLGVAYCKANIADAAWVQCFDNGSKRRSYPKIGWAYIENLDIFIPPKPKEWFEVDENGEWFSPWPFKPDNKEPWTHDELVYIGFFNRHTVSYKFWAVKPKLESDNDPFAHACYTNDYRVVSLEKLTHNTDTTTSILEPQIVNEVFQHRFYADARTIVDITPISMITRVFTRTEEHTYMHDGASLHMNSHPQCVARTSHELFRLIIEWAFAHTHFGNNEITAVTAHNILCAIQMPLNVREELLTSVPAQAVELYVRGEEPFVASEVMDSPPIPPLFKQWYEELLQSYEKRTPGEPFNFDYENMADSYPM